MNSVLKEIITLRAGKPLTIDRGNTNRHLLIAVEDDGSRTAYGFGVPIYSQKSGKLIRPRFSVDGDGWNADGSNAAIRIAQDISLSNAVAVCRLFLSGQIVSASESHIHFGTTEVSPTVNGVLLKMCCSQESPAKIELQCSNSFMNIRANDRCFALMKEQFLPFVAVSGIGTLQGNGLIGPCEIRYQKNDENTFSLWAIPKANGSHVLLEINLHEAKLFQDTTVESQNPKQNNAFGSVAFLGKSDAYGEQWLYSRPDFSRISELLDRRILNVTLHLPQWSSRPVSLSAYHVAGRFCSFGSNWNNKIASGENVAASVFRNGYQSLDITQLVTHRQYHYLMPTDGLILRASEKESGFSAVSTGDSYAAPQILEIQYR